MNQNKGGDEEKTEPKENDKWVENHELSDKDSEMLPSKTNSKLDTFRGRAKEFASNRYHLIITVLCVCLFIFFIIVLALAVKLGTYKCAEPNECRTADCLTAASSVLARSDMTVNPCEDFWAYSCKSWVERNPIPHNRGSISVTDQLRDVIYNRIRNLIDLIPHNVDPGSIHMKVKTFYESCRGMQNIERQFPSDLTRAIFELGGWALSDYPPDSSWDRMRVLSELHAIYDIPVFFQVVVEPDDSNPLRNIIKLKPGGLGLPNRDYYFRPQNDVFVKAYKSFMVDTVKEMGVGLEKANRFADEVFNYEKRLAEITPAPEEMRNTKDLYRTVKIKDLDRPPSVIHWTSFLQKYFPESAFPETEIGVLSLDYIQGVSRIISSTADGVLNNYYMWHFMRTFSRLSSPSFRLVANYFKQTFEGITDLNLSYKENWELCIDETSKYLGHAIGSMYVQKYFPLESQNQVQTFLHKLAASLTSMTSRLPWVKSEDEKSSASSKVRSMFLLAGQPGFVKNSTLDTYYKDLRVTIPDFLRNLKSGVYFLHKKQEESLKRPAVPDNSWTIFPQDIEAEYKYAGNQLVVPAGLFDSPLFDSKAPLAVKYGVLAAHVANKLAESFDDKGINYDEYGTLSTSWLGNDTLQSFAKKKQCLKASLFTSYLDDVQANQNVTIGSFIADIGGVKLAYETYKQHAKEEQNDAKLPNVGLNNDQAFFVSYAQSLCTTVRTGKLVATRDSNPRLPEELRVLSTLQQLPEFSKAFSCSRGVTKMNSREQCRMW